MPFSLMSRISKLLKLKKCPGTCPPPSEQFDTSSATRFLEFAKKSSSIVPVNALSSRKTRVRFVISMTTPRLPTKPQSSRNSASRFANRDSVGGRVP
jgi:hypothetical protein